MRERLCLNCGSIFALQQHQVLPDTVHCPICGGRETKDWGEVEAHVKRKTLTLVPKGDADKCLRLEHLCRTETEKVIVSGGKLSDIADLIRACVWLRLERKPGLNVKNIKRILAAKVDQLI